MKLTTISEHKIKVQYQDTMNTKRGQPPESVLQDFFDKGLTTSLLTKRLERV